MSLRDKLKEFQDAERLAADQRRVELELYERSVNQTLPDISGSQNAIQTALNLRNSSATDEGAEQ